MNVDFETFCSDPQLIGEAISKPWAVFYRTVEGLPLDAEGEEIFRSCTGRDRYEPQVYTEATAICGRRSEKTSTALKFSLWKSLTGGYQPRRGELLRVPVIAQDLRVARDIIRTAKAFLLNSPVLANEIAEVLAAEVQLRNGIALSVYPCTLRAPRGLAIPVCVADEVAFWQLETGANPDREVLRAIRPAMIQFGESRRLVKISTPWMRSGVLYEELATRDEHPERLVWQAPTEAMTPRIGRELLETERAADPSYFAREYEAQFVDDIEAFLPSGDIDAAVADAREIPPSESLKGRCWAAIDASSLTGRDRFVLGVACRDTLGPNIQDASGVVVALLRGWSRAPVPQVCDEIAAILKSYGLSEAVADQYAAPFLKELLAQRGISLRQLPFSARSKPEIFLDLKLALSQGKVRLLNQPESLRELRALESKRLSGGSYRISAPRSGHDDFATVIALLVHEAIKRSRSERLPILVVGPRYSKTF